MSDRPKKKLVLHIEVPDIWADDLDELARLCSMPNEPTAEDRLYVVTEEWMREEVGLTLITHDGEYPDEVRAYVGRIVGAEVRDRGRDTLSREVRRGSRGSGTEACR